MPGLQEAQSGKVPGEEERIMSTLERFWSKVDRRGPQTGLVAGRCYDWTGSKDKWGRGRLNINRIPALAYRWLWEQEHGPVPAGLELDHLCKRPVCVRSSHLEAVTHKVNMERADMSGNGARQRAQTHCLHGHPLSGDNLRIESDGSRCCRTCRLDRQRRNQPIYRKRLAAARRGKG